MSDSPRKLIRHAAADLLSEEIGNRLPAGYRVFAGRRQELPREELPALLVYTGGEQKVGELNGAAERELTLTVEARGRGTEIEDLLDDVAWPVEHLIPAELPERLSDLTVQAVEWTHTGPMTDAIGEVVHGCVVVDFSLRYLARDPLGPEEWHDFKTLRTDLDLGPSDGEPEERIEVQLQE